MPVFWNLDAISRNYFSLGIILFFCLNMHFVGWTALCVSTSEFDEVRIELDFEDFLELYLAQYGLTSYKVAEILGKHDVKINDAKRPTEIIMETLKDFKNLKEDLARSKYKPNNMYYSIGDEEEQPIFQEIEDIMYILSNAAEDWEINNHISEQQTDWLIKEDMELTLSVNRKKDETASEVIIWNKDRAAYYHEEFYDCEAHNEAQKIMHKNLSDINLAKLEAPISMSSIKLRSLKKLKRK